MSTARSITAAGGVLASTGALLLLTAAPSAAATEYSPPPGHGGAAAPAPPKGNPLAGPDFFAGHLDRYHFGRTLVGFDRAASDPYDWGVYHFAPTNLETVARVLSPAKAPAVQGDAWVPTQAPEAGPGHGHGPPSHAGEPLRAPVDPTAGVDYLAKWGQHADPAQTVPAVQEATRRAVTPTEDHPPNTVDKWNDRRPAGGAESGRNLLPADLASAPAHASTVAGRFASGVIGTAGGTAPINQEPILPIRGVLPISGELPAGEH